MRVASVIIRELRAEARHGFTYWLRVLGAGALMVAMLFARDQLSLGPGKGSDLFQLLNKILFILVWGVVPMVVADCISREKRQGTLGLLFLTPLKPRDIVIAKAMAHGLRSLCVFLAAMPVMMIPFLMGGVEWQNAVFSVLVLGSSFCWAIGIGLLASASSQRWVRALTFAAMFALPCCVGFACMIGFMTETAITAVLQEPGPSTLWEIIGWGFSFCCDGLSGEFNPKAIVSLKIPVTVALFFTIPVSFLFLLLCFRLSARQIRRTWREEPPSPFVIWMNEVFCKPLFFRALYHKFLRRKMERNPIGWLQQRNWRGRMIVWGWLGALVAIHSILASFQKWGDVEAAHAVMGLGLILLIAAAASSSFQRERETGLMELLLVSPLRTGQIIWGRLRGIWGQFWMVLLLWAALALAFFENFSSINIAFYFCCFLTLPVVGLYYSLRRRHFLSSLAWTAGMGFFLPLYTGEVLQRLLYGIVLTDDPIFFALFLNPTLKLYLATLFVQNAIAAWLAIRLYRNLSQRKFITLQRGE